VNRILLMAWVCACGMAVVSAAAQTAGLGGTTWEGVGTCGVIYFFPDGTGVATESDISTTTTWTLTGNSLNVDFDNWYGKIAGVIHDGNRLEAIKTWMPHDSRTAIDDPCEFRKK